VIGFSQQKALVRQDECRFTEQTIYISTPGTSDKNGQSQNYYDITKQMSLELQESKKKVTRKLSME